MKPPQSRQGLVVESGANRSRVVEGGVDAPLGALEWPCTMRGRLQRGRRERVRPVVIGDRVDFLPGADAERQGVIESVHPRLNQISRPQPSGGLQKRLEQVVIANLDRLWVVVSLAEPPLNLRFLDRILAASRLQGVEAGVVLNKADLPDRPDPGPVRDLYSALDYPVRVCSATEGSGVDTLADDLRRGIACFVGLSGVGKSSLLQTLQPGLNLRVASVGEKSGHGRHTTTASRLYRLDLGGWLADTPGMREFGLWGSFKRDLGRGFVELEERAAECHFRDCLHRSEPRCAVRAAVEAGEIAVSRLESYLSLVDELPVDELDRDGKR